MKNLALTSLQIRRNTPSLWENTDGPRGATNTVEGLTHSSEVTREGLGMKPTRTDGGDIA